MQANHPSLIARSFLAATLAAASFTAAGASPNTQPVAISGANHARVAQNYGKLPLSFEANQGQSDSQVKFLSRGNGYSLFLTNRAAVLSLTRAAKPNQSDTIEMQLANANPGAQVTGASQLAGTANYFLGNDPKNWHTNVPTYAKVQYTNVYPGIDLAYYGNQRQLEYDFIVAPGANPKPIQLHFAGATKLKLNPNGDLEIIARNGQIAFHKPVLYQEKGAQRQPIEGRFILEAHNKVSFQIGPYDRTRELVIDPTLAYSTYLGGSGNPAGDFANAIAVDANGGVYVAGGAGSNNFPIFPNVPADPTAVQTTYKNTINENQTNAFVTRLNSTGTAIIYSTYLGGQGTYRWGDAAQAIAVDGYGNAYVAGYSGSPGLGATCGLTCEFPITPGAYQTANKAIANLARTAFVAKLSADGTQLMYSTFVGGSGNNQYTGADGDTAYGVAVDSLGEAFIAGTTFSPDYPVTPGAFQSKNNANINQGSNLFVTKLNSTGTGLLYSTYLGGSGVTSGNPSQGDYGTALALDSDGNAYVAGFAHSLSSYPVTPGAYQTANLAYNSPNEPGNYNTNAVISKLDPTGSKLIYSTYLGGSGDYLYGDLANGIAVDGSGSAYIAGQAASHNFPTTKDAFQPDFDNNLGGYGWSGFVTKLNSTGTELSYSTYLSGTGGSNGDPNGDTTSAIAVDSAGDAYVTGLTFSADFPVTSNANQHANPQGTQYGDTGSAYLTEFNPSGSAQVYSSFLGGSGGDRGTAIAVDGAGNAYIAGLTASSNFPITKGAFQATNNALKASHTNAFISKFGEATNDTLIATTTTVASSDATQTQGLNVTFNIAIKPATGGEIPSGNVGISIDGGPVDFLALGASGSVEYSTSALSPTKHTVCARFYGDVFFSASAACVNETILGIPATFKAISGASQTTTYGTAFTNPLVILVLDSLGNPVKNAKVTFSAIAGLNFSPASGIAETGITGQASILVDPKAAGIFLATANVSGLTASASFGSLKVAQAPLTVTANNANVEYGQSLPLLNCTVSGFVNGDTLATATTGACAVTTTAKQGSPVGTYPIVPSKGTLIAPNYYLVLKNGTLTITNLNKSDTPVLTPAAGTFTETQLVTITDPVAGAVIYYTTNGAIPTTSSTKYTTPILVTASETVEAIAVAPDYATSSVAIAAYNIVTSPTALSSPATAITTTAATLNAYVNTLGLTGSYYFQYGASSTALTSTTAKTALTAVATPIAASAKLTTLAAKTTYYYQVVVTTAGGTSLGAILSFTTGATAAATPDVKVVPVFAPTFSPAAGTYAKPQTVTLTSKTSGAVICYSTNGIPPNSASCTRYTGPITVGKSETIDAIAVASGHVSATSSAKYTVE